MLLHAEKDICQYWLNWWQPAVAHQQKREVKKLPDKSRTSFSSVRNLNDSSNIGDYLFSMDIPDLITWKFD